MIPSLKKLADEVADIVANPTRSAVKFGVEKGAETAAGAAVDAVKPVNKRILDFKNRNVTNDDDVATLAALTDILYEDLLKIRINNNPLSKLTRNADLQSVPLSYVLREAVVEDDRKLHRTVEQLRRMRIIFKDVTPACVAALGFSKIMDIKGLADRMTSMVVADVALIKDSLQKCKWGVEVCDKGLTWAGQYDEVINKWLSAHKSSHARK